VAASRRIQVAIHADAVSELLKAESWRTRCQPCKMCGFGGRLTMYIIENSNGLAFIVPATALRELRGNFDYQSRELLSRSSTDKSTKPLQWLPIRSGTTQNM
jgi:hypothetical protein